MDNSERQAFWNVLSALKGQDISEDMQLLNSAIKYPKHIYRFRPISNNSLDALRRNLLIFSSADYYDDPFDSYSFVNWEEIRKSKHILENQISSNSLNITLASMLNMPVDMVENFFSSQSPDKWLETLTNLINGIRQFIQANQFSICFTEEELNETLWMKYADNHKGFVLEYSTTDDSAFLCGKSEICNNCISAKLKYPLYPIYYSDKKYNATEYVKAVAFQKAYERIPQEILSQLNLSLPNMTWEREKIELIKKKCHMYDKEWRILLPNRYDLSNMKERPKIFWRPSSVTIGLRTGITEQNLIIALAREAGIPKIYKCIINENDELDKKEITT